MIDMIDDAIPIIEWSQTMGRKYAQPLHPLMLSDDGYLLLSYVIPKGTKRQDFQKYRGWYRIKYNRDYVANKIIAEVLQPLGIFEYNDFQKIIKNVWAYYKEGFLVIPIDKGERDDEITSDDE